MPVYKPIQKILVADGVSAAIVSTDPADSYYIYGTATLTTSWAVTMSGTAYEGMYCKFRYRGTVTLGTSTHITILGTQLPDIYVTKKVDIECYYNGSVWIVDFLVSFDETNIIATDNIIDTDVTLAKIESVLATKVILGNSSNRPIATTISGAFTLTAAGVAALGSKVVSDTNVNDVAITKITIAGAANKLIVSNSTTGAIEESAVAAADVATIVGVTPGTLSVSKAVIVGATGKIDTLDITTPKINGTTLTATAAEINQVHSVTPGTVVANSVVVVDANKKVDTLDIGTPMINTVAITSTATELNVLDGITVVVADLNRTQYLSNVSVDIQGQIDAIAASKDVSTISADSTLVVSTLTGGHLINSTSASVTVTLPAISTLTDKTILEFTHSGGANIVTIVGHSGDPGISVLGASLSTASFSIDVNGTYTKIILRNGTWRQLV